MGISDSMGTATRHCAYCDELYEYPVYTANWSRFCGDTCRQRAHRAKQKASGLVKKQSFTPPQWREREFVGLLKVLKDDTPVYQTGINDHNEAYLYVDDNGASLTITIEEDEGDTVYVGFAHIPLILNPSICIPLQVLKKLIADYESHNAD